jgi:hypothetical protein
MRSPLPLILMTGVQEKRESTTNNGLLTLPGIIHQEIQGNVKE